MDKRFRDWLHNERQRIQKELKSVQQEHRACVAKAEELMQTMIRMDGALQMADHIEKHLKEPVVVSLPPKEKSGQTTRSNKRAKP